MEQVILIDENNKEIGTREKIQTHIDGSLHRAFSIFIFNSRNELLIQRRAKDKYHCGGLWTNTCCSHPRPGEVLGNAVHRRLMEEMGFDCDLGEKFNFIYIAKFNNGLTEHELDHVFIGKWDGTPVINPGEADNWKWININDLQKDIEKNLDKYTPWFKIALKKIVEKKMYC